LGATKNSSGTGIDQPFSHLAPIQCALNIEDYSREVPMFPVEMPYPPVEMPHPLTSNVGETLA